MARSFETGKPENLTVSAPDGRIWDLRTVPLTDEDGKVVNVIEVGRDVTDHRKIEEQLLQSQKIEALGRLVAGIAHDFNNILSAIVGYGVLVLTDMKEDPPARSHVEQMLESSHRAVTLVQRLLAFGRKQAVSMAVLDCNDFFRGFEIFARRLIRENIKFATLCDEEPLTVMADKGQIEQVMMNPVANACDAMPQGGSLAIKGRRVELGKDFMVLHGYGRPGEYALISVSNTGSGMGAETRKHLFEPFFTTKEPGKGTGLGLAIVYGIIKNHDVFIVVDSEEGKGTTVNVYMPIFRSATAAVPVEDGKASPDIRAIFASGYHDGNLISFPNVHFLPKPFEPQELLKKVREALDFPL